MLTPRRRGRFGRPLIACSLGAAVLLSIPTRLAAGTETRPPADPPGRPSAGGDPRVEVAPHLRPCAHRFAALHAGAGRFARRSMIVTLPDPIDSAFGREFDTFYLAVQQAMASEGFLLDRSCPTWGGTGEEEPAGDAAGADPGAGTGPLHRRQPSALIFRRTAAGDRPAEVYALLLVGELLSTGVEADGMARALELVEPGQPFAAVTAGGERGPVQILGPVFSGSVDSLAVALESWRWGAPAAAAPEAPAAPPPLSTAPLEVVVRSGTATNTGLDRTLAAGLADDAGRFALAPFRSAGSSNDDLQGCAWNRLVPERLGLATRWRRIGDDGKPEPWPEGHPCAPGPLSTGADNTRVALLVELSAYGRQFARRGFRVVDFPPHIAALRKAYQEAKRRRQPDSTGQPTEPPALPTDLPIELRPLALQGLPAFGGLSTLTSQDLVLNNALRQLARDRVQLVAIIATSVEDKLFLTEKVRAFAPDVRVLTFEGDVLLTHPQSYATTAGLLVISSHPLTDPDPVAAPASGGGTGVHLRFDFDGAQGLYLAVRDLVRGDLGEPHHRVWASVVGRNRLSPIARYDLAGGDSGDRGGRRAAATPHGAGGAVRAAVLGGAAVDPTARPFSPSELPTMWRLLLFLVTLLLGLAALAVRSDVRADRPLFGLVPLDLVHPKRWSSPEDSDRILHALVVLVPVALGDLYFVLAFPALAAGSTGAGSESMEVAGLPGGVLTSIASACLLTLLCANVYLLAGLGTRTARDLSRFQPPRGRRRRLRALGGRMRIATPLAGALVLSLVLAFAGVRAIVRIWYGDAVGGTLLVRRALALTGGVSPLLPALLMGGVVLGWVLLALLRRETLCRIAPRHRDPRTAGGDGHGDLCRALWQAIDPLTDGRAVLRWAIVLEVVPLLYLSSLYEPRTWLTPVLRSMEGTGFDLAISALLGIAVLACIAAGVSLRRGWGVLRELVRSIAGEVDMSRVGDPRTAPTLASLKKSLERDGGADAAELARRLEGCGSWLSTRWLAVDRWRRERPADAATEVDRAAAAFHARGAAHMVRIAAEQLRYLMVFLTVALLALFLAVGSYPFEPRRMILVYLGGLIVLAAALSVLVIFQVDKEKELVALAGFGQGSTGWPAIVQRLGFFAGVPALSLLAGRFPELRMLIGNWLGPLVEAVK